jgi:DNA-binding transcriptional ArsR family regulator
MPSNDGEDTESGEHQEVTETEAVFDALGDELSRRILVEATAETVTASSLADLFDVAPATVYRRLNRLSELDLLREVSDVRQSQSSETGYRTCVRALMVLLSPTGFTTTEANSGLDAALSVLLDSVDVTEATFSYDEGQVTATLSTDDETLRELHDSYRAATREDDPYLEATNR